MNSNKQRNQMKILQRIEMASYAVQLMRKAALLSDDSVVKWIRAGERSVLKSDNITGPFNMRRQLEIYLRSNEKTKEFMRRVDDIE